MQAHVVGDFDYGNRVVVEDFLWLGGSIVHRKLTCVQGHVIMFFLTRFGTIGDLPFLEGF